MIFWGLALGVSFISLYDRKGVILRNKSVLGKALEAKAAEFVGSTNKMYCRIDLHTQTENDGSSTGLKNGNIKITEEKPHFTSRNIFGRHMNCQLISNLRIPRRASSRSRFVVGGEGREAVDGGACARALSPGGGEKTRSRLDRREKFRSPLEGEDRVSGPESRA